jgi:hypothetical protein
MRRIAIVVGHLSTVEEIISKEIKCQYYLLVGLVISNICKGVA